MRLFAIGDLHMPGGDDKPMDVFGSQWDRHFLRISEAWRQTVGEDDVVLIPGDISWAMQLEHALPDLLEISRLPGRDICLFCLKEMNKSNSKTDDPAESETGESVDTGNIGDMDSVSGMDEIIPEEDENIPSQEYGEIEEELSLEDVREDEEREADEDEEEEE